MRVFDPKSEVITLFPHWYIYVILTLIDKVLALAVPNATEGSTHYVYNRGHKAMH